MLSRTVRWSFGIVFLALLAGLFVHTSASALDIPPLPVDIPIVDQTNTLNEDQKTQLAQQIAAERAQSGNQIAIVIVPTLQNESLEDYSLKVARSWGIGTGENN